MSTTSQSDNKDHNVTSDALRSDIKALRDDVADLANDTRRFAREKVSDLTGTMRQTTHDVLDRGRHVVGDEYDRALDYARQKPLATLSVGLLAGFLLGTLLRGRGN